MNKTMINKFNNRDTHLIISGYPERYGRGNNYGISWYTKETIEPLAKKKNARFVVLAETNHNNDPHMYQDGHILVLRVFDQRHLSVYPRILKWLTIFNKIEHVYVHSEFAANGGIKNFAFLIPFLMLIRLTGRKVTFFAHNFVTSFDAIASHLNFRKGSLKIKVFNSLLQIYNKVLGTVVDKVVVMDEAIKTRAQKFISESKIISTPIFVKKPARKPSRAQSRAKMEIGDDEFVLLYFGFITSYKGADWLIKKVQSIRKTETGKKIKLILAGGEAYSLKDKAYYMKFYKKLLEKAAGDEHITITGFVPEHEIGRYFQASDLVIYPYRGLIGSSGAIIFALTYGKPFLVSEGMSSLLDSPDMVEQMKKNHLSKADLTFSLKGRSLDTKIANLQNVTQLAKLSKFSTALGQERSYDNWIDVYYNRIFAKSPLFVTHRAFSFLVPPYEK